MSLNLSAEAATGIIDAGDTFILADGTELEAVWSKANAITIGGVRDGLPSVLALAADTNCIAIGDSIYRELDEPPVEYRVQDRDLGELGVVERLFLERQTS